MIKKVFIDTDVILDIALMREPFFETSKTILAMAETNLIVGNVSSNAVANIYYILRKLGGDKKARLFLEKLIKYLTVISINHKNIIDALKSSFTDFEDGLQYFAALENSCDYIITRNIADYKSAKLRVRSPEDFIQMFR